MTVPENADVCIVGAGPAGLSAAIAVRVRSPGVSVAVFDCAVPPIDKACGEGLLPDSLAALAALGVNVPPEAGFRFRGIRFAAAHCSPVGRLPAAGLGLRRTALHSLLVARAQELGVTSYWGAKNVRLVPGGLSVDGRHLKAKFVIAADGQNSSMRRQAALHQVTHESRRYGFRRHYCVKPWSSYMELHWGPGSQIYITPVSAEEIGVALISRDPTLRLDRALEQFPEVRARLQGASFASSERGSLSVSRTLRRVSTKDFALVGDASGSIDALTGEGMGLSFRQALALADSLESGNLGSYAAQHRSLSRRPRIMASLLLLLDRHPGLQKRVLASLASRPAAFEALLAIHVGQGSISDLSCSLLDFCLG